MTAAERQLNIVNREYAFAVLAVYDQMTDCVLTPFFASSWMVCITV